MRTEFVARTELGAFGDRHGPCVGRLHNSCGIRAEFGSGVVLVDKKALPLIQLATCHGC